MGDLITAPDVMARSDYGYADQEGKETCPDTVFFCLSHPPWICVATDSKGTLEGLEPPSKLRQDWNKTIIDNSYPETWEIVNFEERYLKHLKTSKGAQEDMFRISTLSKYHKVCLVCGDEFYHFCIRRLIYEYMRDNGDINP